jgi:DNA polymerase sigma
MWLIKRVLIDKWDNDRALEEATQLGLTSSALKTFALDYIQTHKR